MYVVEAKLAVQKDPESLLGQFGITYLTTGMINEFGGVVANTIETGSVTSMHEIIVRKAAERLRSQGRILPGEYVEKIRTLEQAAAFSQAPQIREVQVNRLTRPDIATVLGQQIDEGDELIGGAAELWQERRIPTPWVYFASWGKLLEQVEYAGTQGWRPTPQHAESSRRAVGISTPIYYNLRTKGQRDVYGP